MNSHLRLCISRCRASSLSVGFRGMSVVAQRLKYFEYGEPHEVMKICEENISSPDKGEILVKILASPINPADINTIQGKYPVKPTLPSVPGNECVAEVIAIGPSSDCTLKVGDRVVPSVTGLGTWASHAKFGVNDVIRVPCNLGLAEASTITVNPCTAYRMLKDFRPVAKGDTVIMNGANSAVGQAVIQLCRAWDINSIGIVRDRENLSECVEFLKSLGASEVFTESQLRTKKIAKETGLRQPLLALNCVGGKSALELVRHLDKTGVMVTYGGMSREPVTVPTAAFIFKDLTLRGFWMTEWTKANARTPEQDRMFDELVALMLAGKLHAPVHELIPLDAFKMALQNAMIIQGFVGKKYIFKFP